MLAGGAGIRKVARRVLAPYSASGQRMAPVRREDAPRYLSSRAGSLSRSFVDGIDGGDMIDPVDPVDGKKTKRGEGGARVSPARKDKGLPPSRPCRI